MNLANRGSAEVPQTACDRTALICADLFVPELR